MQVELLLAFLPAGAEENPLQQAWVALCLSQRMAYSKSKYVEAAQKLLNQGKVPQAIAEYQQILKYEPNDQVTLMTIGELYIRQGETFQPLDYSNRLPQIFVADRSLTNALPSS